MKTSENIDQLATALTAAQGEIVPAPKDATNPHFKSRYADLSSIWSACRSALSKHGLAVIQTPSVQDGRVRITTRLIHKSGQWIESELDLKLIQDTPQAVGSAITYGRRYSLSAMVGVVSDDDDDGNVASGRSSQPPQQPMFDKGNKQHVTLATEQLKQRNIPEELWGKVIDRLHQKPIDPSVLEAILRSNSIVQ